MGDQQEAAVIPEQWIIPTNLAVWPEEVRAVRACKDQPGLEVLIQWQGLSESDATWENFDDIVSQFPSFHLEDKVKVMGGSNDRPPITKVYSRRLRK